VDIVIERDAFRLAGVEVKASATVGERDFRGLHALKAAAGRHFAGGALLYRGARVLSFGDGMHAVPLRALWDARDSGT
ncbi:MAG: AAA family ATPase, partial [Gammaproteobacteria bacterium]|nr:AAA family ATPase [Gammaproteobacteria bacterium]